MTSNVIKNNTVIETITTTKAEPLPTTNKVFKKIDDTVNEVNGLSPTEKIIVGSGAGVIFLGLLGLIIYCCYRSRRRTRRRNQLEISYPLQPLSPTIRRRR